MGGDGRVGWDGSPAPHHPGPPERVKGAYGVTDDLSKKIVESPVSTPDLHATIHAAMGINPSHELMDSTRPVPITDGGKPISALLT